MSKRHQASRRHSYNRRQHELHERTERSGRLVAVMDWLDGAGPPDSEQSWPFEASAPAPADWLTQRSTD